MDTGALVVISSDNKLDHYDKVIRWMINNPTRNMKMCALALGVDLSYLLHLVSSDSFKERLKDRVGKAKEEGKLFALRNTPDKLQSVADGALELLEDRLQGAGSANIPTEVIRQVADMALKNLGYGPKVQVNMQKNVSTTTLLVDREALKEARALFGKVQLLDVGEAGGENAKVIPTIPGPRSE